MNKKAVGLITVTIILALLILIIFLVDVAKRECQGNNDCPENAYCGTDYECHQFPEEIIIKENNFVPAALILGISLIIAAYIFKGGKLPQLPFKKE
ncbi:MAG: hypothetical protein ABIA37_00460 [Candidatus Woesearchaeota archaeon]